MKKLALLSSTLLALLPCFAKGISEDYHTDCHIPRIHIVDQEEYLSLITGSQDIKLVPVNKPNSSCNLRIDSDGIATLFLSGEPIHSNLKMNELVKILGKPSYTQTICPDFQISTDKGKTGRFQVLLNRETVVKYRIILNDSKTNWTMLKTEK